jgi:hypothetical protein
MLAIAKPAACPRCPSARGAFLLSLVLGLAAAAAAVAAPRSYDWADIDCREVPLQTWPGLRCRATNIVVSEGNIGVFRRWTGFGNTPNGYTHIYLWEAQNAFSYLTVDDKTADFLKWMYEHGAATSGFSPVERYKGADFLTFSDDKNRRVCTGFRRAGPDQRGGYQWIMGGILCPSPGKTLTLPDIAGFMDRARLRDPRPEGQVSQRPATR